MKGKNKINIKRYAVIPCLLAFIGCGEIQQNNPANVSVIEDADTIRSADPPKEKEPTPLYSGSQQILTGNTSRQELLSFADSLIGTPYLYASSDPTQGFDCSGFITYVFNHFNIAVPRSSIDFTGVQQEIPLDEATPGDIILFTGTDSSDRNVGHMGIIQSVDNGQLSFIHSTSGKANGVTITPLNDYYKGRFVKVIRVFP